MRSSRMRFVFFLWNQLYVCHNFYLSLVQLVSLTLFVSQEIDVVLYYIRQKQKYLPMQFDDRETCGNTLINTILCAQFDDFKKKTTAEDKWETESRLIKFLMGELRHGKWYHDVNTIYLPLNQPNGHWFLGAIRLDEWRIEVYDSLYLPQQKEDMLSVVKPLAYMLLYALESVHVFEA